jgi:hypothetical protein
MTDLKKVKNQVGDFGTGMLVRMPMEWKSKKRRIAGSMLRLPSSRRPRNCENTSRLTEIEIMK